MLFRLSQLFRTRRARKPHPAGPSAAADGSRPRPVPAIDWLYPWIAVEDEAARRIFEGELIHEVAPGHPLYGLAVAAIGRVDGFDDLLFDLGDGRFAEVHLTW